MNKDAVAEISQKYQVETAQNLVPEGYKQTEVGVIPEDWGLISLSEIVAGLDSGVSVNSVDEISAFHHNKHILKTSCVDNGYFYQSEKKSILPGEVKRAKCSPLKGSIIVSRMNTPNLVGELGYVPKSLPDMFLPDRLWQMSFKNNIELCSRWLAYLLSSSSVSNRIKESATGTSGSMKNIAKNSFLSLKIPEPSKIEQIAIANFLSDTDALLSELEKLIAKKQAIKTATMQQLLTGRTRLPQFSNHPDGSKKGYKQSELGEIPEDWEVAKFGEIGKPIIGLTYSPNDVSDSGTLVLRSSNVQKGKLEYKDNVFVDMELPDRVITQEGDILICVRNGSRQLIGKCALIDKKAAGTAFGAFMSVFRTEFYKFIFYQFQSDSIKNQIEEMMGATINQITNKDMSGLIVAMPSYSAEQTAIATILADMDEEIQALEHRLNKTRQIKQGMMQELLTGKTRLLKGGKNV